MFLLCFLFCFLACRQAVVAKLYVAFVSITPMHARIRTPRAPASSLRKHIVLHSSRVHTYSHMRLLSHWCRYVSGQLRVGLLVLAVHDISDVFLDIMKMANYLKVEGPSGLFLTEIAFVINTYITWP